MLYQAYTQRAYIRPFGVSMLICGADFTGTCLASLDPSGGYRLYRAHTIGSNQKQAEDQLNKMYREDLSLDKAQAAAVEALKTASEKKLKPGQVTMAIIPAETGEIRELTSREIAKYI